MVGVVWQRADVARTGRSEMPVMSQPHRPVRTWLICGPSSVTNPTNSFGLCVWWWWWCGGGGRRVEVDVPSTVQFAVPFRWIAAPLYTA